MATYVKGDLVPNATSYELYEKVSNNYNLLKSASDINFNLDELSLSTGDHILVVKAKAEGYEDSDYSNEVTYTVEAEPEPQTTWYSEVVIPANVSKATYVALEKAYGWALCESGQNLIRTKPINAVRFICEESSGTIHLGKVSSQSDQEGELLETKKWDSSNKDSDNIVTVVLDNSITISSTEWLVFSFGEYGTKFKFSDSLITTEQGFHGRVPNVPSGGTGSRWSDATKFSLMIDYGYVK